MEHITFGLLALANIFTPSALALTSSASVGTSATPVYSTVQVAYATTTDQPNLVEADNADATASSTATSTMSATEAYVRNAFKETPVLIQIARCESQFRQTDSDGAILHGTVDPSDIGVMQINQHYQLKDAKALGLDINTLQGNVAYALVLYGKKGTQPWDSSKKCWGDSK